MSPWKFTITEALEDGNSAALLANTLGVLQASVPEAEKQYEHWLGEMEKVDPDETSEEKKEIDEYLRCLAARLWAYLTIAYSLGDVSKFGPHLDTSKRFQQ